MKRLAFGCVLVLVSGSLAHGQMGDAWAYREMALQQQDLLFDDGMMFAAPSRPWQYDMSIRQQMGQQVRQSQRMATPYDYTQKDRWVEQQRLRLEAERARGNWYQGPTGAVVRGNQVPEGMRSQYRNLGSGPALSGYQPPQVQRQPSGGTGLSGEHHYMGGGLGGRR